MWCTHMYLCFFFFYKQKTAYEMRISDWSSDVCSSDLCPARPGRPEPHPEADGATVMPDVAAVSPEIAVRHVETDQGRQIGRASWRERVCQYEEISVGAVELKKKKKNTEQVNI